MSQSPDPHFPVRLPLLTWGRPDADRSLLLLHGLSSTGGTWWRIASALAAEGWLVTAPDLRGHGRAPRTLNYDLEGYRNDVLALRPETHDGGWDMVVGHSLGGAVTVHAAAADPGWTRAVLLVDPVLNLAESARDDVIREIRASIRRTEPRDFMTGEHPWHQEDAWQRVLANRAVSDHVVESTLRANVPWALGDLVRSLDVPVRILGADPAREDPACAAADAAPLTDVPTVSFTVVDGAGHSIHRDDPDRVVTEMRDLHDRAGDGRPGTR
ncbi:alpha/beta hydrolase [Streptomyces sp. NPDC026672]|uniref:alpha/beta fold hydrolase n=1 Tax=unclassified Streptomyces TaxID=2593676 RepID=UPI0033E07FA8